MASFVKRLDEIVSKNKDKKACGTVVCLGAKDDFASKLETIAKQEKLESVPLTVAKDGATGPKHYKISKDATFTVVVYDDEKKVTNTFAFEKLDDKAQDEALAAFAKVLGVEVPKSTGAADKPAETKPDEKASDKKDEKSEKKEPD